MRHTTLLLLAIHLIVSVGVFAQNKPDEVRRWAIDVHIGGNIVSGASFDNADVPRYRMGPSSNTGLVSKFHFEYYMPKCPLSLKAGYEHEELNYLKGDGGSDLNQLTLGGRWYPAPAQWKVCPYVGTDFFYAVDADRGSFQMSSQLSWSNNGLSQTTYGYAAQGVAKVPRFSVGPIVGADIYLFSSVALQVEYGYRLGFDASYRARYSEDGSSRTSEYHGQLHRHVLSVGLKVAFPFHWTHDDWGGLLQGLLDNL